MKFVFRWALRLVVLLLVALGLLVIFKDALLRSVVERQIGAQTGMASHIGKFETGVSSGIVRIEDLRLFNTTQFGGSTFLHIPELYLQYDPVSASSGKLGFKVVRLNLAELNVVRNAAGELNIDLGPLQKKLTGGANGERKGVTGKPFEFGGIGVLTLTLGKVRYTDLKAPANNREQDLEIRDEVFKNIKSEDDLYGVMLLLMARHGMNFGGADGLLPLKF
jgi:uncharacterized protein involved in outer membrane biogenesis